MESEDYTKNILNEVSSVAIRNEFVKVKTEKFQKTVHNIYVTVCILIIFIGLYFLEKNRFIFSTFIVLGITLLHFKSYLLELIYKTITVIENNK